MALGELFLFGALFLKHLVFAQYTVTTTLLAASAAFLFYTTDISLNHREFIRKNIPVALMVGTAYLVRSEMLLLVLPMIQSGRREMGRRGKNFHQKSCSQIFFRNRYDSGSHRVWTDYAYAGLWLGGMAHLYGVF